MITTGEIIESIIKETPFIENALSQGLINMSSYARYIKPDIEERMKKPVTAASVLMALKRLVPMIDVTINRKIDKAKKDFGDIIVRSKLSDFTYKNSGTIIDRQSDLIKLVQQEKDIFHTISRGVFETTIVISTKLANNVKQIFCNEDLISSCSSLSSITLQLPKTNTETPGLYYYIFKQIAWKGISLLEVVSTTNECTMIVRDKDVDMVFSVLQKIN